MNFSNNLIHSAKGIFQNRVDNFETEGEGVLRFGLDSGVQLKPPNPYPFLRVILAKNDTHF